MNPLIQQFAKANGLPVEAVRAFAEAIARDCAALCTEPVQYDVAGAQIRTAVQCRAEILKRYASGGPAA